LKGAEFEKYKNGRNNRLASWNRRIGNRRAFVGVGWTKNNQITTYLKAEQVTLGLSAADIAKGKVVDNLTEAQNAALTLTKHRQSIAPTYNDLLGGQPFDPANLTDLKYAQAMNLQTNIYTAVLAFGLQSQSWPTALL